MLRAHRRRQHKERVAARRDWKDTGYLFTTSGGQPLHPAYLTRQFRRLVEQSGLPPVRLHDLRHGAASLAHSAADLKTIQEQLGHTSIVLTADTWTSVVTDKHHKTAEATARSSSPPPPGGPDPASGPRAAVGVGADGALAAVDHLRAVLVLAGPRRGGGEPGSSRPADPP